MRTTIWCGKVRCFRGRKTKTSDTREKEREKIKPRCDFCLWIIKKGFHPWKHRLGPCSWLLIYSCSSAVVLFYSFSPFFLSLPFLFFLSSLLPDIIACFSIFFSHTLVTSLVSLDLYPYLNQISALIHLFCHNLYIHYISTRSREKLHLNVWCGRLSLTYRMECHVVSLLCISACDNQIRARNNRDNMSKYAIDSNCLRLWSDVVNYQ